MENKPRIHIVIGHPSQRVDIERAMLAAGMASSLVHIEVADKAAVPSAEVLKDYIKPLDIQAMNDLAYPIDIKRDPKDPQGNLPFWKILEKGKRKRRKY